MRDGVKDDVFGRVLASALGVGMLVIPGRAFVIARRKLRLNDLLRGAAVRVSPLSADWLHVDLVVGVTMMRYPSFAVVLPAVSSSNLGR